MGKKGSKGGKKSFKDDSDEDELNTIEDDAQTALSEKGPTSRSNFDVSENIDMLAEKKINLREPALRNIIAFLQGNHDDESNLEVLHGYIETLTIHLVRMTRRPASVKEGKLCMDLVRLLGLYLGPEDDAMVKAMDKPLLQHIDDASSSFQADALFTQCFLAYVSRKEERLLSTLDNLQILLCNPSNATDTLLSTCIDCWVLLGTLIPASEALKRSKEEVFEALAGQLDHASTSRLAAARAIGFLYECADSLVENAKLEELTYLLCEQPHMAAAAIDAMKQVAKDSSKKVSKKSRKEQRAEFRDLLDFLESGEQVVESLHMQGADVTIEGFGEARVADALRTVLGSGFHSALVAFPIVREMLGVEYMSGDGGEVAAGKKASKGSEKGRAKDRQRDRDARGAHALDLFHENEICW
jgi:hypothetical protein